MPRNWKHSVIRGCAVFLAGFASVPVTPSAAQEPHKRVLILHSFGRDFFPYDEVVSTLKTEVVLLCETDFITGETIRVDGGRHLA